MLCWKLLVVLTVGLTCIQRLNADVQAQADEFLASIKESDNANPKSASTLAYDILKKGFEKTHPDGLSLIQVMEKVQAMTGPVRYYAIRMFEKMDENFDGQITASEMAFVYDDAISSASEALKMMFQIKDFDRNGFITPWEIVRENMALEGNNLPISTLWRHALDKIKSEDLDEDGVINVEEFILGMVMQTDKSILQAKRKARGFDPSGTVVRPKKYTPPEIPLRKAHKASPPLPSE